MVGPSITSADRARFLVQLKVGFALLVGLSMALVTLYSGAGVVVALGVAVAASLVGGVLAEFTFPDSIGETPYEDSLERGPKPGTRMQRRREEEQRRRETEQRAENDRSRR